MRAAFPAAAALALAAPAAAAPLPKQVAFWNAHDGVALGSSTIMRTHDGGRTWRVVSRIRATDVDVAGRDDAWVLGPEGLLHSADGGRTWHVLNLRQFSAVSFADRAAGIAIWGRQIATTGDGGRTWRARRSPCTQATDPIDVSAGGTSRRYVLCTGQPGAGSQPRALWQSLDGGRTWTCTYCDLSMSPGYAQGIDFVHARGWLWYHRGTFTSTPDGGRSWTTLPVGRPEAVEGESASHYSARGGYVLLHDMRTRPLRLRLAHTSDGGRTWRDVRVWRVRFWPR